MRFHYLQCSSIGPINDPLHLNIQLLTVKVFIITAFAPQGLSSVIVRNDREYFHHDIFAITIVIRETMGGGGHTIARDTVSRCHVTEASMEALCHAGPHYVTVCQIQTQHLQHNLSGQKARARNQSTIATKSRN